MDDDGVLDVLGPMLFVLFLMLSFLLVSLFLSSRIRALMLQMVILGADGRQF